MVYPLGKTSFEKRSACSRRIPMLNVQNEFRQLTSMPEFMTYQLLLICSYLDVHFFGYLTDDAVPELNDLSSSQIRQRAQVVRQRLSDLGLVAEFVAPR